MRKRAFIDAGSASGRPQRVDAGKDDDRSQYQIQHMGRRMRVDQGTGIARQQPPHAHRDGNAPVNAPVPLVQPGSQKPRKQKAEQGSAHGHVRGHARDAGQGRNEKNAADADSANQRPHDNSHHKKKDKHGALPPEKQILHSESKQHATI